MKVLVYVEGPGDRASLEKLFRSTIDEGRKAGVGISFHHGGGKDWILQQLGRTAARHLKSNPEDYVFALPDLYPMAKYERTPEAHRSLAELRKLLQNRFQEASEHLGLAEAVRAHYRPHVLQHDLEVLLLGSSEALRQRLRTSEGIEKNWRKPVETQNDGEPPKRVVERLFMKYLKRRYGETIDAPWVLERASTQDLCSACPQSFKPLFIELSRLAQRQPLE